MTTFPVFAAWTEIAELITQSASKPRWMVFGERDLLEVLGFTLQFLPRGSTGVVVLVVRRFRPSKATMACRVGDRCYQNVNRTPIEKFYFEAEGKDQLAIA
jgi:hypothetical protein